jgi:hypothetical protein
MICHVWFSADTEGGQNNGNIKKLQYGICFGNIECSSICLHSVVIVLNDSPFERGQIVATLFAGASVTKTATLLSLLKATVSKVMLVYTDHGKTTNAKRNSGWKS